MLNQSIDNIVLNVFESEGLIDFQDKKPSLVPIWGRCRSIQCMMHAHQEKGMASTSGKRIWAKVIRQERKYGPTLATLPIVANSNCPKHNQKLPRKQVYCPKCEKPTTQDGHNPRHTQTILG